MRLEGVGRLQQFAGLLLEMNLQILVRIFFPIPFVELGLRIEQVHLAGATMLEKTNDRFCLRRMMRGLRCQRMETGRGSSGDASVLQAKQMSQGEVAEAAGRIAQERTAIQAEAGLRVNERTHINPHSTNRKALLAKIVWQKSVHFAGSGLEPSAARNSSAAFCSTWLGLRPTASRNARAAE